MFIANLLSSIFGSKLRKLAVSTVSSFNSGCNGNLTTTGSVTGYAYLLKKQVIGANLAYVIPSINNWRRQINTQVLTEGEAYQIESFTVVANSVGVPATRGGLPGPWVVPKGATDWQFDPIPATAFGLTLAGGIPVGNYVAFKEVRTLGVGTDTIQGHSLFGTVTVSAQQSICFNPANTTINNPSDAVAFTTSGIAAVSMTAIACDIILLGSFITSAGVIKSAFAQGDSITYGTGASNVGSGYFAAACTALGIPNINMAVSGALSSTPLLDNRELAFTKYCNIGYLYFGQNDFGPTGVLITEPTMSSQMLQLRDAQRSYPGSNITKQIVAKLTPRTTGTYADEASQSYVTAWGPTGQAAQYSINLDSKGFQVVIDFITIKGVDLFKWLTPSYTADGLHPQNIGHQLMSTILQSAINLLR